MKALTSEEERMIVDRRKAGDTIFAIACDIDRAQAVVWRCLRRHGLTSPRRRVTAEQRALIRDSAGRPEDAARSIGVSRASFYRYRQCVD